MGSICGKGKAAQNSNTRSNTSNTQNPIPPLQRPVTPNICQRRLNSCKTHASEEISLYCSINDCKRLMCKLCYAEHEHKKKAEISETLLKEYRFLRFLGKGGSGRVFSVEQNCEKSVLKVIDVFESCDEMSQTDKTHYVNEFMKEAEIHRSLKHDNIIHYFDHFYIEAEERLVIKMEEADRSLSDELPNMTVPRALTIFGKICSAVFYLKTKKIIHRDLKPGNILLKHDNVKVCDFGGAKLNDLTRTFGRSKSTDLFLGTPEYHAPEIFNVDSKQFTYETDVWALGVILFKMVTKGRHPLLYEEEEKGVDEARRTDKFLMMKKKLKKYQNNMKELRFVEGLPHGELIISCLRYLSDKRDTVEELIEKINELQVNNHVEDPEEISFSLVDEPKTIQRVKIVKKPVPIDPENGPVDPGKGPLDPKKGPIDPETFNQAGNDLFVQKKYEEALREYEKAIKVAPEAKFYSNKCACLMRMGHLDDALRAVETCLEKDPRWVKAYAKKGEIYLQKGEYELALQSYKAGLAIKKDNPECLNGLGKLREFMADESEKKRHWAEKFFNEKKLSSALKEANAAIHLNQENGRLFLLRAQILVGLENWDQAMLSAKEASEKDPGSSVLAFEIIGDCLLELNRDNEAKAWFQKGLAKDPNNKGLKAKLGKAAGDMDVETLFQEAQKALKEEQDYDRALELNGKALAKEPRNIKLLLLKADILETKGDQMEGLAVLKTILQLDDKCVPAYLLIGKIFMEMSKLFFAAKAFQEGLQHNPTEIGIILCLKLTMDLIEKASVSNQKGVACYALGNYPMALGLFDEALKINEQVPSFHFNKAGTLLKLEMYDEAQKVNETYLTLEKEAKGYAQKAAIHLGLQETDEAKEAFEEGLKIDPNHEECQEGLKKMTGIEISGTDLAALLLMGALMEKMKPEKASQEEEQDPLQNFLERSSAGEKKIIFFL